MNSITFEMAKDSEIKIVKIPLFYKRSMAYMHHKI